MKTATAAIVLSFRALVALSSAITPLAGSETAVPSTPPRLVSVELNPVAAELNPETADTVVITATAVWSDGQTTTVETGASWTTSNASHAVVKGEGIVMTSVEPGTAEVTATFMDVVSAPAVITVTEPDTLIAIRG